MEAETVRGPKDDPEHQVVNVHSQERVSQEACEVGVVGDAAHVLLHKHVQVKTTLHCSIQKHSSQQTQIFPPCV